MDSQYWQRQTPGKPLFPDLLWSRPENRSQAGKLLVLGGNLHGFSAPATAYATALKAGAGSVRVMLPDATKKMVGPLLEGVEFAPSTPSGSFARNALGEILPHASWADAVLVAGDTGRNSETAITIESLAEKTPGQLTLTREAVEYFYHNTAQVVDRPETLLVMSLAQLQRLATNAHYPQPVLFSMGVPQLVELLHRFTTTHAAYIIVRHLDMFFVAVNGQVSTTRKADADKVWRVTTAAQAAVWWLQHPGKPYEALTTALADN